MNVLNEYVKFKKKCLLEYTNILYPINNDYSKNIINEYIDTYIKTSYFHILQTLDVDNHDIKTIYEEFKGKKLEIVYLAQQDKQIVSRLADTYFKVVLLVVKIDKMVFKTKEELINNLNQIFNNSYNINNLLKVIISNKNKEIKFFETINYENYSIKYQLYRNTIENYNVSLNYNLPLLNEKYSDLSINKNFNEEGISEKVFITTLNMLNIDILKRIINDKKIGYYFVKVPNFLLNNKEKIIEILSYINNEYLKNHIILIINFNYYLSHKKLSNLIDIDISFAAIVDLSRCKDIEAKLDKVDSSMLFKYIIIDKYKSKDRDEILKYTSNKELFFNEISKENV